MKFRIKQNYTKQELNKVKGEIPCKYCGKIMYSPGGWYSTSDFVNLLCGRRDGCGARYIIVSTYPEGKWFTKDEFEQWVNSVE
jgi:hypothetical protein